MTKWYVEARTNSTLALADTAIELTMERLTLRKLFNDVGTWLLQLRSADPHASTFMRQSGGYPNGILVWVDNEDGQGKQLVMSGPQRGSKIALTAQNEKILYVNGVSDEYWLYKRLALPNPFYDYTASMATFFGGALRQYALADTSGTTAVDSSSHAQNGTYQGGFTLNQTSLIDDPGGAVLLNGTSGDISVPTTGLPTGNNPWTVCAWGMLSANPAAEADLGGFGTNASKQGVHFGVLSTGKPFYAPYLVTATSGATAVTLNVPFLLAVTWDGTTMTGYLCQNNVVSVFGTSTPGAMSVTYGTCLFGAGVGPANFWTKFIQQCGFYGAALTNANINFIYAYGLSRFAESNYTSVGAGGGGFASGSLILLVNYNAGSNALPATTFTNVYATHTARPIPLLTTATDPLIGSDVIGLARFDILLDMLAALALQSTPELGFKLEQSGANLVFTVYQPPDLTGTAIFSHDLYGATGNVLDYTWEHQAGTSTHIIAGGANPVGGSANLNQRLFGENEDATAITRFGYLETFLDFRQAPDGPTLQQAIAGKLASDKETLNINLNVIDQPGVLYFKGPSGKGYDLGSKVTVILDGQVFTEIIREVDIDLQGSQPAQVMAAIGTPLSAAIINEYTTMVKRLADAGYRVHALDTNY